MKERKTDRNHAFRKFFLKYQELNLYHAFIFSLVNKVFFKALNYYIQLTFEKLDIHNINVSHLLGL